MYHCNRILTKMKKIALLLLLLVSMMNVACDKPVSNGDTEIHISYTVNGHDLITDSLCYTNAAGNQFLINEIQWFISNVTLIGEQGDEYALGKIFYIDTNIPKSQVLSTASVPCQRYTSMRFTFGLDREDNVTGLFANPPERDMFWPEPLGGGYHYMKLNGKYLDEDGNLAPMNIHLGIGQNEDLTTFYQNYFTVELPLELDLKQDCVNAIQLNMNIDNWFQNPHIYDCQTYGSAIMQNQEAQQLFKENGHNVFSISSIDHNMEKIVSTLKDLMHKAAPKPHFYTKKNMESLFADFFNHNNKE